MSIRVFGLACLTLAVLAVPASATDQTNGRSTTTTGSTNTNGSQALGTSSIFDRWGNLLTQPDCTSAGGKWNAATKTCQAPSSNQR